MCKQERKNQGEGGLKLSLRCLTNLSLYSRGLVRQTA